MSKNFNTNYSRYYDLLYKDKDYAAEAVYIANLIRSECPLAKKMLELGCGTGNHAAQLCKSGFEVTGLERSEEMVTLAKQKKIPGFNPLAGDIENFELEEKFDVAISLFHVISYLNKNESLVSCLTATSQHLNTGGIFIFDVWYSPAVNHLMPTERTKNMDDDHINVTRHAIPVIHYNENVVDVNYEIIIKEKTSGATEVHREKHPMRHFSIPEIDLLAKLTGFNIIKVEEFLTANHPGKDTWGVCFMLQKK